MAERGLIAPPQEWSRRDTTPDEVYWNARPATELDEACARRRVALLTSAWPFHGTALPAPTPGDPLALIVERLVRGESTWEEAHVAAAQMYAARNELDRAAGEYRALVNQIPRNVSAYLLLGQILVRRKHYDEAASILEQSLLCERTVYALQTLGNLSLARGAFNSAAEWFRQAYDLSTRVQERIDTGYLLARALWEGGDGAGAQRQVLAVLQMNPRHGPSRALLEKIREPAK